MRISVRRRDDSSSSGVSAFFPVRFLLVYRRIVWGRRGVDRIRRRLEQSAAFSEGARGMFNVEC